MTRLIWGIVFCIYFPLYGQPFQYSGTPFTDKDWGKSYRCSAQDIIRLKNVHNLMVASLETIRNKPGDYGYEMVLDMSHPWDSTRLAEAQSEQRCGTCYFTQSPEMGKHFYYGHNVHLPVVENSPTYLRKAEMDDSLGNILLNTAQKKRQENNQDEAVRSDMAAYQKKLDEFMLDGNLSEAELVELERIGSAAKVKADANANAQSLDKYYQRNLMMESYNLILKLNIATNEPFMQKEKALYASMRNNPDYIYEEVQIPGASFACIYFDKYQKANDLPYSEQFRLFVYFGNIYNPNSPLPSDWIKPFCLRLSLNGNRAQLKEMISKIDFAKLAQIIQ